PEAGFFGVVPGTNSLTNPNAMATIAQNTIYTNVAVTPGGVPWWEGKNGAAPEALTDWRGQAWDRSGPAAHPNSRFTAPASQCPSMSPRWEDPQGVPLSAIVFGARRTHLMPLVVQTLDWEHGVFAGATMGSETTAAAIGQVGVVRRDPMAMLPFCGYNMGDYFAHWLKVGERLTRPPAIFCANWFRTGADGKFLWPGYGENVRVLIWMIERLAGKAKARETAIGLLPDNGSLNLDGLDLAKADVDALMSIDRDAWAKETDEIGVFFDRFGDRLPRQLHDRLARLSAGVRSVSTAAS
ncbi:MAG: phosphoenolpyruvate carboxykinase (GTP), partial [Vicinamibacteria bacterium]|nr:phosphoenolpyruvate carboxykinase (GTP) [Vicinamibacteria bacterium]